MKTSRRAKRMQRHHAKKKDAGLNMVALMDIFTILVFFLLVSSASVQDLPSTKDIKLPESVSDKLPKETLVILVSNEAILVQGKKISDLRDIAVSTDSEIPALRQALKEQSGRRLVTDASKEGAPVLKEVTIMGDKQIPYKVLKKIMYTCATEGFGNISLAVIKKSKAS